MKIAIAGAHGVGKTSLAKTLVNKLNLNYIKKGFVVNENTPPEVHLWLTLRQWGLEKTTPESWIGHCFMAGTEFGSKP
jgi:adenylate kinase family enzyme